MLFFFTFKSFIARENFNFHVSLEISFPFLLWFIIQFIKNFEVSEELLLSMQTVDLYAMLVSFGAIAKVISAIDDKTPLKVAKVLSVSFLVFKSGLIFLIASSFIFNNNMFPYIYNISFVWYFLMVSVHLPTFREYKYIKIALVLLSFRFIYQSLSLFFELSTFCKTMASTLTTIGFTLLIHSLYVIYRKSRVVIKKHPN